MSKYTYKKIPSGSRSANAQVSHDNAPRMKKDSDINKIRINNDTKEEDSSPKGIKEMNRYKKTPNINLSSRLTKKLAINSTNFLNMLNSGLTSELVATRSGVSTRTIQRLRRTMVQQLVDNTDHTNWNYKTP